MSRYAIFYHGIPCWFDVEAKTIEGRTWYWNILKTIVLKIDQIRSLLWFKLTGKKIFIEIVAEVELEQ